VEVEFIVCLLHTTYLPISLTKEEADGFKSSYFVIQISVFTSHKSLNCSQVFRQLCIRLTLVAISAHIMKERRYHQCTVSYHYICNYFPQKIFNSTVFEEMLLKNGIINLEMRFVMYSL
jgi:hypothetical protein